MIVLNASAAKLEGQKLVLDGISPNAIIFADRPVRSAGHALTAHLLEEWRRQGPAVCQDAAQRDGFGGSANPRSRVDAVVVLKSPKLEGERLTFDVESRRRSRRR